MFHLTYAIIWRLILSSVYTRKIKFRKIYLIQISLHYYYSWCANHYGNKTDTISPPWPHSLKTETQIRWECYEIPEGDDLFGGYSKKRLQWRWCWSWVFKIVLRFYQTEEGQVLSTKAEAYTCMPYSVNCWFSYVIKAVALARQNGGRLVTENYKLSGMVFLNCIYYKHI